MESMNNEHSLMAFHPILSFIVVLNEIQEAKKMKNYRQMVFIVQEQKENYFNFKIQLKIAKCVNYKSQNYASLFYFFISFSTRNK